MAVAREALADGAWHSVEDLRRVTGMPFIELRLRELEPEAEPEQRANGAMVSWGTGKPMQQRWRRGIGSRAIGSRTA